MVRKSLIVIVLSFGALVAFAGENGGVAQDRQDGDVAQVRSRYVLSVLPRDAATIEAMHEEAAQYAATLPSDGSWSDVDYGDTPLPDWKVTVHLRRTLAMAKSARLYRNAGKPDAVLEGKLLLAIEHWTSHDYVNHLNPALWWWNEIGVPELIGEIGNLTLEQLPPEQVAKLVTIMKRSNWRRVPWTGANLSWGVTIEIARGCMENNPDALAEGYARMYEEIRVVSPNEDGIQQDESFHQHGKQLYSGGYGLGFANDVGRFVSFAWGTRFEIPADRMAVFSAYLLDGEQWMIRGDIIDYSTVGREITRKGKAAVPQNRTAGPISPAGPAYSAGNVMGLLAAEPTPRQKEFAAFAARLDGRADAPEFTGNKQFWCSDYMAHRRAGYFASVKMMSTRIRNAELVNGEGKTSQHLSDGLNYLYLTGDEYKDIFPVWDWTKLPGTTAIQGTLETGEKNPIATFGTTTFNGGVSDGTYGMAAMDLKRGGLAAKKAWFFFDDEYVALGAGVTLSGDAAHAVVTDVNQTLLAGAVVTSEGHTVSGVQALAAKRSAWVWHGKVGYILVAGTKAQVSAGPQTGKWTDSGFGSPDPVTLPVFNLWIDHGRAPQGGTYDYVVVPNAPVEQVAKLARHPETQVLENSERVQGVYNKGLKLAEIAFRQAGLLATPVGAVEADHSCLLLVRKSGEGWKVTASNPENMPLTLHVKVKGRETTIELPGGNLAGSSVSAEVR